jgi:putative transposase
LVLGMKYDSDQHHRRSIRLRSYDYSQVGAYFVTICTQGRLCLFGDVVYGEMKLNDAGWMIESWWLELRNKFPSVEPGEYVVMPNHFHGIIAIVGADLCVCPDSGPPKGAHIGAPLPKIVQWFKAMTTNEYIRGVKQYGWTPFLARLWQRNYYEHIIRNQEDLDTKKT